MLKRLFVGLLKGLFIGAVLGAVFHFGLGWAIASGLFAYLLAMGAGASAGILAGKPPWRAQALIESVLKAVAGLGVGALVYWLASKYLAFGLPMELPGLAEGTLWTEATMGISLAASAVFGTIVELDNTDDAKDASSKGKKVRVASKKPEEMSLEEELAASDAKAAGI